MVSFVGWPYREANVIERGEWNPTHAENEKALTFWCTDSMIQVMRMILLTVDWLKSRWPAGSCRSEAAKFRVLCQQKLVSTTNIITSNKLTLVFPFSLRDISPTNSSQEIYRAKTYLNREPVVGHFYSSMYVSCTNYTTSIQVLWIVIRR